MAISIEPYSSCAGTIGYGGCDRLSIASSIAMAASISVTAAAVSPAACAATAAASRACIIRICCTNGCWPGTRARSIISAALAFAVAASFLCAAAITSRCSFITTKSLDAATSGIVGTSSHDSDSTMKRASVSK